MNARFGGGEESKGATSFKIYVNFSQDTLFLSTRFAFTSPERTELERDHPYESAKLKMAFDVLPTRMLENTTKLVLGTSRGCHTCAYCGEGLERFRALKHAYLISGEGLQLEGSVHAITEHLNETWTAQDLPVPRLTYYPYFICKEYLDDPSWFEETDVLLLDADGIREVEWGFRKDFWVPRARQGSGTTLQKLG
jgi:hypothetical protein